MDYAVLSFACLVITGSIRSMICSSKTLKQRNRLREVVPMDLPLLQYMNLLEEIMSVPFMRHHWHLFFFRNPILLYSPRLQFLYYGVPL